MVLYQASQSGAGAYRRSTIADASITKKVDICSFYHKSISGAERASLGA
jgi:hypothetical protein